MDGRLSSYHLGVLQSQSRFDTQPWNQGAVQPLLQHGLIEPTGQGLYGQSKFRNTDKGNQVAKKVVLHQGQFHLGD